MLEAFDWSEFKKDDTSTWPPEHVRITDHLVAGIILHDIAPIKRAARWSVDFDTNGWLRKNRPNFGPASRRSSRRNLVRGELR